MRLQGNKLKVSLLFILLSTFTYTYLQEYSPGTINFSLNNIAALTSPGDYSIPKWSPDGDKILFTKMDYSGLYVINLRRNNEIVE